MGSVLSHTPRRLRNVIIRLVIRVACLISAPVHTLFRRIRNTPGLPCSNPTDPYWLRTLSPIATHNSDGHLVVPAYADVVVIGSGITGTSFLRTLLDHDAKHNVNASPLQAVLLEARDLCSGATGRCIASQHSGSLLS